MNIPMEFNCINLIAFLSWNDRVTLLDSATQVSTFRWKTKWLKRIYRFLFLNKRHWNNVSVLYNQDVLASFKSSNPGPIRMNYMFNLTSSGGSVLSPLKTEAYQTFKWTRYKQNCSKQLKRYQKNRPIWYLKLKVYSSIYRIIL